jgi:hypothetical protein
LRRRVHAGYRYAAQVPGAPPTTGSSTGGKATPTSALALNPPAADAWA